MAEIAIVSSRKARLESLAKKGDPGAIQALKLHNDPTRFLSTVQVGITLIGILTGAFSGGQIAAGLQGLLEQLPVPLIVEHAKAISFGAVILVVTFVSLIIGELVPKQIGLNAPEKIAGVMARPMTFLSTLTRPFVTLLSGTTGLIVKLLKLKEQTDNGVTEEEIKSLVAQGANSGDVEEVEHDIIQRVFNLGDRRVGSLMTNRIDMEWIDLEDDMAVNRERILNCPYSALPLCKDGVDNVVGILYTRSFFKAVSQGDSHDLLHLAQKPLFIPENMTGFNLLEKFRELHTKVGVVVDEFGAVQGMVTMSDIIDALVGEMEVSAIVEDSEIIERPDGSHLIDALIPFDEFIDYFEIGELIDDEDRSGFHTLGGFILHLNEQIPRTGEIFIWKDFSFEVVDMDGNRIDKILVRQQSEKLDEE
jgi:putative hemolysin